jgi:hypothetical protein
VIGEEDLGIDESMAVVRDLMCWKSRGVATDKSRSNTSLISPTLSDLRQPIYPSAK